MWLYFNVRKRYNRLLGHIDIINATGQSTIELTEHSIRWPIPVTGIDFFGRKMLLDGNEYEFDRFDVNGSAMFVRNER